MENQAIRFGGCKPALDTLALLSYQKAVLPNGDGISGMAGTESAFFQPQLSAKGKFKSSFLALRMGKPFLKRSSIQCSKF